MRHICLIFLGFFAVLPARAQEPAHVGDKLDGGIIVTTQQLIRPAGQSIQFEGRPVDLCLSPDRKTAYLKSNRGLIVVDLEKWTVKQELPLAPGGSMHGILATPDGKHVYPTDSSKSLCEADIDAEGKLQWGRKIELKGADRDGASQSAGIALTKNSRLIVCMAIFNQLGIVDLQSGEVTEQIDTGIAPYDIVLSPDEKLAYVSNWGGRRAKEGDKTAKTAGTTIPVDNRSIASTGTVSIIDLETKQTIAEIATGLHPSDLELSRDGKMLYVANANSDSVTVIDTNARQVTETISVRPDPSLNFGSAPNALALSDDGSRLYVANGGNNAVAVIDLASPGKIAGFIPTGWYPGALALHGDELLIANVKGIGSREPGKEAEQGWGVRQYAGTMTRVKIPSSDVLARYTEQAKADAHVPESLRAWEKAQSNQKPLPVPKRIGEPSVFEHVVYVIKENRTYDQVLGDIGKGNSDPKLCIFGKNISPNHHALADQFVLLDNFYCNGVVSADGHAWATEGFASDYWEKSFGGFTRIYFQGDATTPVSSGFIWDNVLLHGLSFRNYGEKVFPDIGRHSWFDVYNDFVKKSHKIKMTYPMTFEALRPYTCPDYPGWNTRIPDALRIEAFLREFKDYEAKGTWPNMVMVYLPQDHTGGMSPNFPHPECMVADNDLAVGKLVDAVSHSKFWPKTCIFVIEDDPQAGFDHVDGHRSLCLVASPYTKRGAVVSNFYNQTSVLHTMELILGIPPMTQMDAMAPVMSDCFTETPDTTPYTFLKNNIALDTPNKRPTTTTNPAGEASARKFIELSEQQNLTEPDRIDDDAFNRILWFAAKGNERYPVEFAGPHGKGLKALKLKFDGKIKDDDDD